MLEQIDSSLPQYPTVRFLIRWGRAFTGILTVAPIIVGLLAFLLGSGWIWLALSILLAPVIFLIISSYMELIRIIGDTLLPR